MTENSARNNGKYLSKSFEDVVKEAFSLPETRTPEDIITHIRNGLKSFGEEDS